MRMAWNAVYMSRYRRVGGAKDEMFGVCGFCCCRLCVGVGVVLTDRDHVGRSDSARTCECRGSVGEGAGAPKARLHTSAGAASSSAGLKKALLAMMNLAVAAIPSFVPSRSATMSWGEMA